MKKNNTLIKRNALLRVMKENGLNRVNKEALDTIEGKILNDLVKMSKKLSQDLVIKGKKTLKKEDLINEKNRNYPEI